VCALHAACCAAVRNTVGSTQGFVHNTRDFSMNFSDLRPEL